MSKVKLTKKQADLLEQAIKQYGEDLTIIRHVVKYFNLNCEKELFELTTAEVAKAIYIGYEIEPEFKVGDIVKDGNDTLREVAEVKENGIYLYVNNEIKPLGWHGKKSDMYKQLRHATDVEVESYKKRRFWHENGREVGEFKKNDILSVEGANYAYTISKVLVGKSNKKLYKIDEDSARYTKEMLLKGFVVTCFAHDRKDIKND